MSLDDLLDRHIVHYLECNSRMWSHERHLVRQISTELQVIEQQQELARQPQQRQLAEQQRQLDAAHRMVVALLELEAERTRAHELCALRSDTTAPTVKGLASVDSHTIVHACITPEPSDDGERQLAPGDDSHHACSATNPIPVESIDREELEHAHSARLSALIGDTLTDQDAALTVSEEHALVVVPTKLELILITCINTEQFEVVEQSLDVALGVQVDTLLEGKAIAIGTPSSIDAAVDHDDTSSTSCLTVVDSPDDHDYISEEAMVDKYSIGMSRFTLAFRIANAIYRVCCSHDLVLNVLLVTLALFAVKCVYTNPLSLLVLAAAIPDLKVPAPSSTAFDDGGANAEDLSCEHFALTPLRASLVSNDVGCMSRAASPLGQDSVGAIFCALLVSIDK